MDTILQSCGLADCVASSYGGRNRKCAAQFALWLLEEHSAENSEELSDVGLQADGSTIENVDSKVNKV